MASWYEQKASLLDTELITPMKVSIQNGKLLYLKWPNAPPSSFSLVDANLLRDFIGLRSGDFEQNVIKFAKRYGTLQLCEHSRPIFHNQLHEERMWGCREVRSSVGGWDFEEPLSVWRRFSLQAQALRNIAEPLRRQGRVADADLNVFDPEWSREAKEFEQMVLPVLPSGPPHVREAAAAALFPTVTLRSTVREWLRFGGGELQPVYVGKGSWSLGYSMGAYTSTFGAIAFQLLREMIGPTLTICRGCLSPFTPRRRVDRNRDQFCGSDDCRREAWRLSKEAQRKGRAALWRRPDLAERNRRRSRKRFQMPKDGS